MDWADYLRDQAAKYRQLAETAEDPTFALRAVEHVVANQSRTDRETLSRLWDILDDPHLNQALGLPQDYRMTYHALYCVLTWQAVIFAKTVF